MPTGQAPVVPEWKKVLRLHLGLLITAILSFSFVQALGVSFWTLFHLFLACYLPTIMVGSLEAIVTFARNASPARGWDEPHSGPPSATFIVPAYLPNEVGIILHTLQHLLTQVDRPEGLFQVILAYNSPVALPIEQELAELAVREPVLRVMKVNDSHSKAENLNAALAIAEGEITVVIDADHRPRRDCLWRAWRWLAQGYDAVQGRTVVRNGDRGLLSALASVEFEVTYAVSHFGKSILTDTGIFAGQNGYWRTPVLREIGFDPDMLTEDIDVTVRAQCRGHRIVVDRSLFSDELAPERGRDLWYQRKRWAQGWMQVALRHQMLVMQSLHLNSMQKAYWTYMLGWQEVQRLTTHLILPLIISAWMLTGTVFWPVSMPLVLVLVFGTISLSLQLVAAYRNRVEPWPLRRFVGYFLAAFLYVTVKNTIALVALRDQIMGERRWVVTPRGADNDSTMAVKS